MERSGQEWSDAMAYGAWPQELAILAMGLTVD